MWLAGSLAEVEALIEALKMNGLAFENVHYGEIQLRGIEEATVEKGIKKTTTQKTDDERNACPTVMYVEKQRLQFRLLCPIGQRY